MLILSRRAFLGWLAASVPAAAFVRRAHAASISHLAADPRTLRALGDVVLPAELGAAGTATAVDSFQRWIIGYKEGAERVHGYGTSRLDFTGPTPATRWASQLDHLDSAARSRFAKPFADVPVAQRREMIVAELTMLKVDRLPSPGRAPHVALALLAHFYASGEATDLCYQARIGQQTCRPLANASRKPLPLARGLT
jgi:hypothetical protein